ncbi:MAG: phosphoenolpyruvate-protein phosphotransferase [Cellvibrionaceae bacterium]|jgi:phosphoenolpyruvate-protein phosphotransferase
MKQLDLVIQNETGLHARPAKTLVNLAKTFQSTIKISHGAKKVNAKSMISVLTLGVKRLGHISIEISGDDEAEASDAILHAVQTGLGEPLPAHDALGINPNNNHPEPVKHSEPAPPTFAEDITNEGFSGVGASPGIVSGPIVQYQQIDLTIPDINLGVGAEEAALMSACKKAEDELHALVKKVSIELSAEEAEIFEAHLEILSDPDLINAVQGRIADGDNAAASWQSITESQASALAQLNDKNLAARAADIRDVARRVLSHLLNQADKRLKLNRPVILIARDLSPSDTAELDKRYVLGFMTAEGGPNAHSAIIARALGIPAIVGVGSAIQQIKNDTVVIMNGQSGTIDVDPSPEQLASAVASQAAQDELNRSALESANEQAVTLDGHLIEVMANAGSVDETIQGRENGAEGIGLLRTEFLFLGREQAPDEENQVNIYRPIIEAMGDYPIVFRTLDIGGDKPVPYINVPHEENPFLGERGLRLMLTHPELLRTQLRALLRAYQASGANKMCIMFPMVGQLFEWQRAKAIYNEVRDELKVSTDNIQLGIMIEVPSAALNAAAFVAHGADFFSIGTNDLTQYTLAIDRQHPTLSGKADGLDPAVLHLINLTVKAAHQAGKWVGVCGELAADPAATAILVGLGVDELSVNVNALPGLKARIRTLNKSEAEVIAQKALLVHSAADVRALT